MDSNDSYEYSIKTNVEYVKMIFFLKYSKLNVILTLIIYLFLNNFISLPIMNKKTPKIVCFGEVLWDFLPSGKVVGGAPMNVAYHANQLGIPTQMISKIGRDLLGENIIDFLNNKRMDTTLVQIALDANDSPVYEIVSPVAWDYIQEDLMNKSAVKNADAFVFGSLSTRNETSRNTLLELLNLARLKVFDVNLRSPYYNETLIMQLLNLADIVKMNDEELEIIGKWMGIKETAINWEQLIVTRGAKGAWLFNENGMISSSGITIQVKDTIGSGDSFLAAFLSKILQKASPKKCLEFASMTGAYVATRKGGTPVLSEKQIIEFINNQPFGHTKSKNHFEPESD